jgi:two-component system response regulator FlrC
MNTRATTHPAESTGHGIVRAPGPAIVWVHPAYHAVRLVTRQVLGRDGTCHIVLEGREVSRRHAEIYFDGPVVTVRDLQSRNGVFVNGRRTERGPLVAGDVLRCGEWVGVVTAHASAAEFGEVATGWFGGAALREATDPARRAPSDLPIVVQGETGTGKEGLARAIHAWSQRRGPWIAVNCAALSPTLAESQLFGHRKGAFTGADQAQLGFFRAAHGGTIFLDELLELPVALQPKLLRAVEQQEIVPVGETAPVSVDVKIVAATQEPLDEAVREGRFRVDLYARLNGLTMVVPPLRARREDVIPLLRVFLSRYAGSSPPALDHRLVEALCLHDWPMNVRELAQLTRQLLNACGDDPTLKRSHLPAHLRDGLLQESECAAEPAPKREWRRISDRDEYERLISAMNEHDGSVAKAAASLGLQRARAYRLLAAHSGTPPGTPSRSRRR